MTGNINKHNFPDKNKTENIILNWKKEKLLVYLMFTSVLVNTSGLPKTIQKTIMTT